METEIGFHKLDVQLRLSCGRHGLDLLAKLPGHLIHSGGVGAAVLTEEEPAFLFDGLPQLHEIADLLASEEECPGEGLMRYARVVAEDRPATRLCIENSEIRKYLDRFPYGRSTDAKDSCHLGFGGDIVPRFDIAGSHQFLYLFHHLLDDSLLPYPDRLYLFHSCALFE